MTNVIVVIVDSSLRPRALVSEIVSQLEFDHRATVKHAVVFTKTGRKAAEYERKQRE